MKSFSTLMLGHKNWLAAACIAGATLFVLAGVWARYDARSGFTSLIRFGEWFEDRRIEEVRSLSLAVLHDKRDYTGAGPANAPRRKRTLSPGRPERGLTVPHITRVFG